MIIFKTHLEIPVCYSGFINSDITSNESQFLLNFDMSENSIIETRVLTLKSCFDRNKLMYYCNHALYMDLYITAIGYCISYYYSPYI